MFIYHVLDNFPTYLVNTSAYRLWSRSSLVFTAGWTPGVDVRGRSEAALSSHKAIGQVAAACAMARYHLLGRAGPR